jgi:uncharacterized membrane protein
MTFPLSKPERLLSAVLGGALVVRGLAHRNLSGLGLALAGSSFLRRAATGKSRAYAVLAKMRGPRKPVEVRHALTVQRPRAEVYAFWQDPQNRSRFLPGMQPQEWKVVREEPDVRMAWEAHAAGAVEHCGEVTFHDAPGGRGTEVKVTIAFTPVGGRPGQALSKLSGNTPGERLAEGLRRMRQLLEAGEIATVAGQPAAHRTVMGKLLSARLHEGAR